MTVNTVSNKIIYTANGSTVNWSFAFPAVAPEFIKVTVIDVLGVMTPLPANLYTVTLNPAIDPNPTSIGGVVVFPLVGPPLEVGNKLLIFRALPAVQETSISNQSIVYPPVIEEEFDYLTLLIQEGSDDPTAGVDISRAFKVGPADPPPALVPPVAQRASQAAFFDSLGNLTPGAIPGPGVFISAAMKPVVEAITLQLARDLLGVAVTGDLKTTHNPIPQPGWIQWLDGTIGGVASGADVRANADTQALFSLYFGSYNDPTCPLLLNTGAATTRAAFGNNATSAFNANCRMTLPRGPGRAIAIAGSGIGLTLRVLGSSTGVETVTPSIDTMAPHTHGTIGGQSGGPTPPLGSGAANANMTFGGPDSLEGLNITSTGGGNVISNMQPSTFVFVMVKL